jgi:hypothetical protein
MCTQPPMQPQCISCSETKHPGLGTMCCVCVCCVRCDALRFVFCCACSNVLQRFYPVCYVHKPSAGLTSLAGSRSYSTAMGLKLRCRANDEDL